MEVGSSNLPGTTIAWRFIVDRAEAIEEIKNPNGGLAQLARVLAWHARGQRFESVILHDSNYGKRYLT